MATKPESQTPEEYISSLEEPRRSQIQSIFDLVRSTAPELEPWVVSGKIGFGKFSYQGKSKGCSGEWFKLAVGSNKNTIMFATCAMVHGKNLAETYGSALPKAKIGRSCINFRKFEDIDFDVLKEITERTAAASFDNWLI